MIAGIVIAVLVLGALVGAYAVFAPRRKAEHVRAAQNAPLSAATGWTSAAGDDFAGLSESARCDMIFAVAALGDEASRNLLEHALSDPAEPVALAAAHVLATHGRTDAVETFLAANPGERADRIAATLALLQ